MTNTNSKERSEGQKIIFERPDNSNKGDSEKFNNMIRNAVERALQQGYFRIKIEFLTDRQVKNILRGRE